MPRIDGAWWDLELRYQKLDQGIAGAQQKLAGLVSFIRGTPMAALAGLGAAVALVGAKLTQMGVQFDDTMRRVAAALPGGLAKLEEFKRGVLALASELKGALSPEVLAAGLRQIITVGGAEMREPAAALERLRVSALAAVGAQEDLGRVIGAVDDLMDAFGDAADRTADHYLTMLYAVSQGRAPLGEMLSVMQRLAPFAAESGVRVEELAAAVAAMFETGKPPMLAIRALRQAIAGVDEEGRKIPKMAQDLGVNISLVNGHLEVGGALGVKYAEALAAASTNMGALAESARTMTEGPGSEWRKLMTDLGVAATRVGNAFAGMIYGTARLWRWLLEDTDPGFQAWVARQRALAAPPPTTVTPAEARAGVHEYPGQHAVPGPAPRPRRPPSPPTAEALATAARERADLLGSLADRVAAAMGDARAVLDRELDAMEQSARTKLARFPEQLTAALADIGRLRGYGFGETILANLDRELDVLAEKTRALTASGRGTTEEYQAQLAALQAQREHLTRQLDDATLSAAQHERIRGMLTQITALEGQVLDAKRGQASAAKELVDRDQARLAQLQAQARNIEAAARGALQLARAFGLVDDASARALENVVQIAANIPALLAAIAKGSTAGILGAGLAVAGGLAGLVQGLFGGGPPTAAEQEQRAEAERLREQLEKNAAAIMELTRALGDSTRAITGREYAGISAAAAAAMAPPTIVGGGLGGPIWSNPLAIFRAELDRLGITAGDLERVFRELGLDFDGVVDSIEEIRVLAEALAAVELDRLATTFAGQMELLRRTFEGFDITDPIEQLKMLQKAIAGLDAGALEAVGRFDLTTAEGRAAADAWMREIFAQATGGGMTPEQLGAFFGGLTPQEWLDAWAAVESAIDAANQGGATAGVTQQWGVNRTITEATASRQLSLLATIAYWAEEIARNTQALRAPSVADLAGYRAAAGSGGLTLGAVNVTVQVTVERGADGRALGQAVGAAAAEELNRQLYQLAQRRARALGQATLQ